ncbi:hypothetical protein SAMN05444581_1435 [Methylocapsa palsarum]|uniref:Uncharacterized protein n=1 Tax=Methylocapsa palsarum TaxID=1612308 RepID=A0A1I4D973_9HYPH|nr:hypothetical protein SAMN05444581_1435 [Methylocapsa palsarum]
MLEFDTGVHCGELPISLGVVGVLTITLSYDSVDEGLFVRDAAIQALRRKDVDNSDGRDPTRARFYWYSVHQAERP